MLLARGRAAALSYLGHAQAQIRHQARHPIGAGPEFAARGVDRRPNDRHAVPRKPDIGARSFRTESDRFNPKRSRFSFRGRVVLALAKETPQRFTSLEAFGEIAVNGVGGVWSAALSAASKRLWASRFE
jgi:chorismate-pyruvate lyase